MAKLQRNRAPHVETCTFVAAMTHELYMQRSIELARNGIPFARPNPLVGAVLVHQDRVIGEGWHAQFGQAHAEVNCLNSVCEADKPFIQASTLYVTLEPCSHTGKTPPCANRIVAEKIPHVVIASTDPSEKVNGRGIALLREAGIRVDIGIMEKAARDLNPGFFTYHEKKRPHITLKWAESADGFVARSGERTPISGPSTQFWVHDLRRQHQAIWVGMNTVIIDQPQLNNRLLPGPSPIRITYDRQVQVPEEAHYFQDDMPAWIFTQHLNAEIGHRRFIAIGTDSIEEKIIQYLYQQHIQTLLVEGGPHVLQTLIQQRLFDTIWRIQSPITLHQGIPAPTLASSLQRVSTLKIGMDTLACFNAL
ncbi:MAG: bifunctional diaminohydroxyphosphoribosylaminopyrimidine deaminase/5-amino-6-(5-phosphoribosylamino)uracil reductase RibD [Chitinophagaceae bacterium]|nr:bifunctional diaminohydroxyphosphoribosylaminopyrimidine deaminase/5-amino-6-(5-phosphoribosylamino)uracil reductase RibD [Chitinophagaceae bacterium]